MLVIYIVYAYSHKTNVTNHGPTDRLTLQSCTTTLITVESHFICFYLSQIQLNLHPHTSLPNMDNETTLKNQPEFSASEQVIRTRQT